MENQFFTVFFEETTTSLSLFIALARAGFDDYISPIIRTGCLIYIVLYGFSVATGKIREPMNDALWRNIKVAIILGLTIWSGAGGAYDTYIAGPAQSFAEEAGSVFLRAAGGDGTASTSAIDSGFNAGWESGQRFFDEGSFRNIGLYFIAIGVWAATLLFTIYSAFLFLLSKIALAILLALGPLFIAFSLFEQTKRFTEAWIAQVINYALIPVIASGVLGLTIFFFTSHATVGSTDDVGTNQAAFMVIIAFLSWVVMKQVPSIASGLAGGASLNGQGAFGGIMSLGRMAGGAARAGFNRTALGRELQVRRADRMSSIQREGRSRSIDRERRQAESGERRRAAFAAAGTSAGRAVRGGMTSGVEQMARLRDRLSRRP